MKLLYPSEAADNRLNVIILAGIIVLCAFASLDGGGFGETTRWVVAFAGVTMLILTLADRRRFFFTPPKSIAFLWCAFLFWAAICVAFSAVVDESASEWLALFGTLSCAFLAATLPATENGARRIALGLLFGATLVVFVGWYFFILGRFSIEGGPAMVRYFVGTFFWKNPMAGYIVLFLPLSLAFSMGSNGKIRWFAIVLSILMLGGLVLTRSRGGWLAFASGFFLVFLPSAFRKVNFKKWLIIVVIALFGVVLAFLFAPKGSLRESADSMSVMFSEDGGESATDRIAMLKAGFRVIKDYPIFGVGPRAWPAVRAAYLTELIFLPRFPHNAYLRAAAETGIPGFILLVIALFFTLFKLLKEAFSNKSSIIFVGIVAGVVAELSHFAVDFDAAFLGITLPMAVLVGVAFRLSARGEPRPLDKTERFSAIVFSFIVIVLLVGRFASATFLDKSKDYFDLGRLDVAASSAKTAAALNKLSWEAPFKLSAIYARKKDIEAAEKYLYRAISLAPAIPELHAAMGKMLAEKGDTAGAIESFEKSIARAPRASPDTYFRLYRLKKSSGDIAAAKRALLALVEFFTPLSNEYCSPQTAGFRYKVASAWENLAEMNKSEGDSIAASIAEANAAMLFIPREKDWGLKMLGYDSPSPELTVIQFFDALSSGDTIAIRASSIYKTGNVPRVESGVSMRVQKILDVSENISEGFAEVEVILRIATLNDSEKISRTKFSLLIEEGRWAITFAPEPR